MLLACSDSELVVVGPEAGSGEPRVEALSTPPPTDAPGTTSTSTSSTTTSSTTTTTVPPTDGDDGGADTPGDGTGDGGEGPAPTTPPAPVTPPPAGAQAVSDEGGADRSLEYVNEQRARNGRGALAADADLDRAALDWARQLAESGELGHNPRLREVVPGRYGWVGENVAMSWTDANIDQMWWDSEGHRNNILGENYTAVGIAFVVDSDGQYWAVQVFGG